MSLHSSLRVASGKATASQRNVLKRHERVRHLMEHGSWADGRSVFGLPKLKQMKIKSRKSASKEKDATAAATSPTASPSTPS